MQEDKEKNNDDKNDNQNKGDTPLEFKVPYHLIVSLNFDYQSKNESALSDSNNKKPLYSIPHACMYSPTSSIPEGKLFLMFCHSSLALCASSLFNCLEPIKY